ncbi:acyl-CoA dehydrogenase family protein [Frankia sp. AgKG'84/4]|uniref:acyl-CoA dehydrogenase family protein n=1 Tax=Frankia sp. AgKG'84/4 TaxID=573490 RepID=UPI00200F4232|nr:acyl-CoA dehydrogenase family protein [Frankia sp. AgKG'84/4]MCL9795805.1 acyl-CoA dehydrogenase family protein [Frankia sp. AgKG'84/4]
MRRDLFEAEHEALRETARTFVGREIVPHQDGWLQRGPVDRSAWRAAGAQGPLGIAAPNEIMNEIIGRDLARQHRAEG